MTVCWLSIPKRKQRISASADPLFWGKLDKAEHDFVSFPTFRIRDFIGQVNSLMLVNLQELRYAVFPISLRPPVSGKKAADRPDEGERFMIRKTISR